MSNNTSPKSQDLATSAETFYISQMSGRGRDFSAGSLLSLRTQLLSESTRGLSYLSDVHRSIADALEAVAGQWLENEFEQHEAAYQKAHQELSIANSELDKSAKNDQQPPLYFWALLSQLTHAVDSEHSEYLRISSSPPDFVNLVRKELFYVGSDQTFLLAVSVGLPAGGAPVERVQLLVRTTADLRPFPPPAFVHTLRPGETRELVQQVEVSEHVLGVGETMIPLSLRYRSASGQTEETPVRSMLAVLEPAGKFTPVSNPYRHYSGGAPVEERDMFFGRKELLDRIHSAVTNGPLGQCFVLYGQKRSGKSSVLRQLHNRLRPPNLPVYLSLGEIDTAEAGRSFVQACIDQLYRRLVNDFGMTDILRRVSWPSDQKVAKSPIESFRRSIIASATLLQSREGWRKPRPIFLIDEFTYVYEYIREGLLTPAFMRQWKSLLESRTFDAVLVGQDTMPRFKDAYANEFGVTHDERISYLDPDEAQALAVKPIMIRGESRYRGAALDRLISLTAGSPFYLQIFCDRLVQHLNRSRLVFITESMVSDVLRELTTGHGALPIDKFDPLITAGAESVAVASKEKYLSLLTRLALNPEARSGDVQPTDASLVRDLIEREVLERDADGGLRVRVGLFTEWLASNNIGIIQ